MAIYRFTFAGHYTDGVQTRNSLHYVTQPPALGEEPNVADVLDLLDTELTTVYNNCMPGNHFLDSESLSEMVAPSSGDVPAGAEKSKGGLVGGISSGDGHMPEAITAIIALRTGVPLRSARGYVALPSPIGSAYLNSSAEWTGTYLAALNALAAKLDDDYELGTVAVTSVIPVVYSRTRHARGFDPPWFQVQAGVVRQKPSWRRSRTTAP